VPRAFVRVMCLALAVLAGACGSDAVGPGNQTSATSYVLVGVNSVGNLPAPLSGNFGSPQHNFGPVTVSSATLILRDDSTFASVFNVTQAAGGRLVITSGGDWTAPAEVVLQLQDTLLGPLGVVRSGDVLEVDAPTSSGSDVLLYQPR